MSACYCGGDGSGGTEKGGLPVAACSRCGVIHLAESHRIAGEEYADYHLNYSHSIKEDAVAASKRVAQWKSRLDAIQAGARAFDLGSGYGELIKELRRAGMRAEGCEVSFLSSLGNSYQETLPCLINEDLNLPRRAYRLITCIDVLEHLGQPKEVFRIARQSLDYDGSLIIEIPDFFHEAGAHHWKPEHSWYWKKSELIELAEECGFKATHCWTPHPGKVSFVFRRQQKVTPLSIIVLAGIGDSYWSLVKVPAILKELFTHSSLEDEIADVYVETTQGGKLDRSGDFIEKFPWASFRGYATPGCPEWRRIRHEAYMMNGRSIIGLDDPRIQMLVAFNGALRYDKTLESIHPEYPPQWDVPWIVTPEEYHAAEASGSGTPYAMLYLASSGMYQTHWLTRCDPTRLEDIVRRVRSETSMSFVLVGAGWDVNRFQKDFTGRFRGEDWFSSMVGETSFPQLMGLMRNASACFGFPSGITVLPPAYNIPTGLLWSDYFCRTMWDAVVHPRGPYASLDAGEPTAKIAGELIRLWSQENREY